jgi:hypothetical protein
MAGIALVFMASQAVSRAANVQSELKEDWENARQRLPDGWEVTGAHPFIDDIVAHKGRHSLKLTITASDTKPEVLMPEIAVKPGEIVKISLHVKEDPFQGRRQKSSIVLQLRWQESKQAARTRALPLRTHSGSVDWTQVTGLAKVPKGVSRVRGLVGFPKRTDGVLWLDDVDVGVEFWSEFLQTAPEIWAGIVGGFLWAIVTKIEFAHLRKDLRKGDTVGAAGGWMAMTFALFLWLGWSSLLGLLAGTMVCRLKRTTDSAPGE